MKKLPKPRARHTDPETSHEAAAAAAHSQPTRTKLVLDFLQRIYPAGATTRELEVHLDIPRTTVSPAPSQLEKAGKVVRTDEKRASFGARPGIVWKWKPDDPVVA